MKQTLILFLLLLIVYLSTAQRPINTDEKDKDFSFEDYRVKQIALDSAINESVKKIDLAFSSITIIDSRYSSKSLGFITAKNKKGAFENDNSTETKGKTKYYVERDISNIVFNGSIEKNFLQYIKTKVSFTSAKENYSLLVIIKKLWLTDKIDFVGKRKYEVKNEKKLSRSGIDGMFEFYLFSNDNYWPLHRFETKVTGTMQLKDYAKEYIEQFIDSSLAKLSGINFSEITTKRKSLQWSQIEKFNAERFQIPILKDSVFKKGVYRNFSEFKNNTPYHSDFVVEENAIADILRISDNNGLEFVERNAWGYCDGKNLYIKNENNFSKLVLFDKCFFLKVTDPLINYNHMGSPGIAFGGGMIMAPTGSASSYVNKHYLPSCLNLDTGEIY